VDGDNAVRVFYITQNAAIDGFSITNGHATGDGGGINNNAYLIITNCTFFFNSATDDGGGIYNTASLSITNSTFYENSATDDGGGIYNAGSSSLSVTNSTFFLNSAAYSGGGIYNTASLTITNSTFFLNSAAYDGGGIRNSSSSVSITNSTFYDNSADNGGGIYNYFSDPTITNCTFSRNIANVHGGGIYNSYSDPTITNSIVWGNFGEEIYNSSSSSSPVVTYSDVEGGYEGEGNIDADPLFVNWEPGPIAPDLHLTALSPAIDSGTSEGAPATDIEGNPRPQGDGYDMGAYEYYNESGMLRFSAASYSVNEDGGSVTITVNRTGGSTGAVSVDYATADDTANAGSDYSATSGTLDWDEGEVAAKNFMVNIIDDDDAEGEETLTVILSNATGGATIGSPDTAVLTIVDHAVMVYSPESIEDTLRDGESSTHTLTLSNTGEGLLTYNLLVTTGTPEAVSAQRGKRPVLTAIPDGAEYAPGELIVKLAKGAAVVSLRESVSATVKKTIPQLDLEVWTIPVADEAELLNIIGILSANPNIEYAEPNYVQKAIGIPNDARFNDLWGMHNTGQTGGTADADIDAVEAWDTFTGSHDVVVAVIDTGVDYNHVDLVDNRWINVGEIAGNGIDDDGNGFVDDVYGYDFVYGDSDPMDGHSHGTHCSGTIGGVGNNSIGVAGVAHTVRIMAVKFLDDSGSGSTDDAIESVLYAVDNGAHILSNSWGGDDFSQGLEDAISYANDHDVLFVAAAGNDGRDTDVSPHYPSSYDVPNVLAVAATDHNDAKPSWSNYGLTSVDLGAPGVDTLSTEPGNSYGYKSGTSMATPHVSGAAALVKGYNPGLSALDIKSLIMDSVDPVASMAGRTVTGGRLNLNTLMEIALPPWIELEGELSGEIPPGGSVELTVRLDATGLMVGDYTVDINVDSNDPANPEIAVPVTLHVLDPSVLPFKNDVIIDFGPPTGIYAYLNNDSWTSLHSLSAESMVTGDLDNNGQDEVIIDFGPSYGIWLWMNNSARDQLHTLSPESMVTGDIDDNGQDEVIIDFGPSYGIWLWMNNSAWVQLHTLSPESMVTGDIDDSGQDDVIIDFGPGSGIWLWMNNSAWEKLHSLSSESMVTGDLDGNGQDEVIIDFGPSYGIWLRVNNSSWLALHSLSPESMITGDIDGGGQDDVIIDFGDPYGFWVRMNNSSWVPFISSAEFMVIGELDRNGQDDVIISFGAPFGIWVMMNNSNWVKLHNYPALHMVTGNIDGLPSVAAGTAMRSLMLPPELENTASLPKAEF